MTKWGSPIIGRLSGARSIVGFGALGRLVVVAAVLAVSWSATAGEPGQKPVDFNFEIRPILSDKCFKCHGPDPRNRKAGLRLDTREGAFGTTESGSRAVVPGNLEESELVSRITSSDETERMPPRSLGRTLSSREIDLLKRHGSSKAPTGRPTGRSCALPRRRCLRLATGAGAETRSIDSCSRAGC